MIEECPSNCCTTFAGNSRPPRSFRLMHQLAKKWRSACKPYLGSPALSTTPAALNTAARLLDAFLWCSTSPLRVGKTSPASPLGQPQTGKSRSQKERAPLGVLCGLDEPLNL